MIFVLSILGELIISNNELFKGKHLRIKDRLDQNYTLKELAERAKKDSTTISKEIKRTRFLRVSNKFKNCSLILDNCSQVAVKEAI